MEYLGFTLGDRHFYYRCLKCRKYTEYRISLKDFLIMNSIILLMMVFAIALPLSVLSVNPLLAIVIFLGSVVLFSIVGYKYGWYFCESIALDNLPTDLWIIHAPSKRIRWISATILTAVLLAYAGIVIFNLMRE